MKTNDWLIIGGALVAGAYFLSKINIPNPVQDFKNVLPNTNIETILEQIRYQTEIQRENLYLESEKLNIFNLPNPLMPDYSEWMCK